MCNLDELIGYRLATADCCSFKQATLFKDKDTAAPLHPQTKSIS